MNNFFLKKNKIGGWLEPAPLAGLGVANLQNGSSQNYPQQPSGWPPRVAKAP
jgi:hypothetical protein